VARKRCAIRVARCRTYWPATDGEINFLWSFIDGSIMHPESRERLHRAWGFCERHAWIALAVEMAFRPHFIIGPAVLYDDLMERAAAAFRPHGPVRARRLAFRLRSAGPCLLCELKVADASGTFAPPARVARGRSTTALRRFALEHKAHWSRHVCGACRPATTAERCRPHLIADIRAGKPVDLAYHRACLDEIRRRVAVFLNSYCFGYHGTDTAEDRAALLRAIGWCSGWAPLLGLVAPHGTAGRDIIAKRGEARDEKHP
jgi:hypothetical protein